MNFTNTDCVAKFLDESFEFRYGMVGFEQLEWQVNDQVFWQVFYQFNPILHEIHQEIKK